MSNKNLYNSELEINDLLRRAHPGGSKEVFSSPTGEGIVEDSIDAQKKILQMVSREPVFKVLASLADELDSEGLFVLSNKVDDLIKVAIQRRTEESWIRLINRFNDDRKRGGLSPTDEQKSYIEQIGDMLNKLKQEDPDLYNKLKNRIEPSPPSPKSPGPPVVTTTTPPGKTKLSLPEKLVPAPGAPAPGAPALPNSAKPALPTSPANTKTTVPLPGSKTVRAPTGPIPLPGKAVAPAAGTKFSRLVPALNSFRALGLVGLAGKIFIGVAIISAVYDLGRILYEGFKWFEAYRESQGLWDATLETIKVDLEKTAALLKSGKPEDLIEGSKLFRKVGHMIDVSIKDKDMTPEDFKKLKVLKDAYDNLDKELGAAVLSAVQAAVPGATTGTPGSKGSGRRSDTFAFRVQEALVSNGYPVGTASGKPDGIWGRTSNASMLEYATNLSKDSKTKGLGDALLPLVGRTPAETTPNLRQIHSLLYGEGGRKPDTATGRKSMPKDTWAIDFTSSVTNKEIKGFPLSYTIRGLNREDPESTAASAHDHKLYLESMGALPRNSSVEDLIKVNVDITQAAEKLGLSGNVGPILRLTEEYFQKLQEMKASQKTIWDILDSEFAQFGESHPYYKVKNDVSGRRSLLNYLTGQDLCNKEGIVTAPIGKIRSSILSIQRAAQNIAQNLGLPSGNSSESYSEIGNRRSTTPLPSTETPEAARPSQRVPPLSSEQMGRMYDKYYTPFAARAPSGNTAAPFSSSAPITSVTPSPTFTRAPGVAAPFIPGTPETSPRTRRR